MMKIRLLVCIATIAILACSGVTVFAQTPGIVLESLKAVKEGDWRTARPLAEELAGGSQEKSYDTLRAAWGGLDKNVARQEIVNAFLKTIHPDALKVALLGLEDRNAEVRRGTAQQVAYALGLSNALTPEQAKAEIARHKNRTLEQVRADRARGIVARLRTAKPDVVGTLLDGGDLLWRSKRLREISLEAGLLQVLRGHLVGDKTTNEARIAVVGVLGGIDVPASLLNDVFAVAKGNPDAGVQTATLSLLAAKHYRPAYNLLKARLLADLADTTNNPLRFRTADALAKFGEPELIPLMIGVIAADNYDATYWVGYYGLSPLTGVPFNETHDGEWWKLWWETHRNSLPVAVRDLPIPALPRSATYQEPMARAVHADRAKLRAALVDRCRERFDRRQPVDARTLATLGGAAAIPTLIGLIASDNTEHSVYGVGYFGLTPLTGVPYSPLHDGNWWKLWYEMHRGELPESVRDIPVPEFPRTAAFREPLPFDTHRDRVALRRNLTADLRASLPASTEEANSVVRRKAEMLADLKDGRSIPEVIEMLPAKVDAKSGGWALLEQVTLAKLTGVPYEKDRSGTWWRNWWQENRAEVEKRYPATEPLPDFVTLTYRPPTRTLPILVADCGYDPQVFPTRGEHVEEETPADLANTPSVRQFAGGDKNKLYRLVGFDPKAPVPEAGYSLLLILPGGDGGEDFRWFVQRIKKNALPKDMLVAQLVAPQWGEWQEQNLVWPTRKTPFHGMKFSTEEFIEAAIADVKRRTKIAPTRVYTLAWSSSGPAVYTHLATKGSSAAGAFIAMSIFRPDGIPDPENLRGKRVYLYHSPQDFIKIRQARDGEAFLKSSGANVRFAEYAGGHGWHGDVFGAIQNGMAFLSSSGP